MNPEQEASKALRMPDMVNNPSHYNQGRVETIEVIRDVLSKEQFIGYCVGNTMKYVSRHRHKNKPKEDLLKARWYLNKAIEEMEK